jgi:multidrug efflux pump subunit AcrA (membrane-fusion protein)
MFSRKNSTLFLPIVLLLLAGCQGKESKPAEEESQVATITPVTVDSIQTGPVAEYLELNATSSFLKKNSVKSPVAGYIQQVEVNLGDEVTKNKELFLVKTKEASALDNNSGSRDSAFMFSGLIRVRSFQEGVISTLNRHAGDFVQEGDELCMVSDKSSFVFVLDVPYELHQYIHEGGGCEIVLPDKQTLAGTIASRLPSMDVASQTESYLIRASTGFSLPENLIARIRIIKERKDKALTLPKTAILSNETQTEFWVMKLINDSVAIKIPVKRGLETSERTEITSPLFESADRILVSGNYGLTDTAKIVISKKE